MSPNQFQQASMQVNRFVQGKLPAIVGVEGVKHFKASFDRTNQGFTDQTLNPWPDIAQKTKDRKRRKNGNMSPILTDTGDLGDSITYSKQGDTIVFSTDVPYAQRHNEGLNGMKKRQFWGASRKLNERIVAKIDRELTKIFSPL